MFSGKLVNSFLWPALCFQDNMINTNVTNVGVVLTKNQLYLEKIIQIFQSYGGLTKL